MKANAFTSKLLKWFETEQRDLPWKQTKDPYFIWISEIILQQTRVEQGLPYYEKFIKRFPTIQSLAKAREDQVLKMWEGLGYYTRARNIHHTAKYVTTHLKGTFPSTYKDVLALKGVGPYTAAAIMSFAFNEPYAVVDGNVLRVVSRYLASYIPVDTTEGYHLVQNWLNDCIPLLQPGDFNQAIMNLGATICTPTKPNCSHCPVRERCRAYKEGSFGDLPVKIKKITKRNRYFHYFLFQDDSEQFLIQKRIGKDIWKGLYELPMVETEAETPQGMKNMAPLLKKFGIRQKLLLDFREIYHINKHLLTHQTIYAKYYLVRLQTLNNVILSDECYFVNRNNISNFAFPKLIKSFIDNYLI